MSTRVRALTVVTATMALLGTSVLSPAEAASNNNTIRKLTNAVTVDGVLDHLEALQAAADANGGDRAVGRPGFASSRDYVVSQLEAAGYSPSVQEFEFPYIDDDSELIRVSPNATTFVNGTDFLINDFDS